MPVFAGLFRALLLKQVNAKNYAKVKDLVNTLSRYIKDGKLKLTRAQNKVLNQQKNELKRFESRLEAVPVKPQPKDPFMGWTPKIVPKKPTISSQPTFKAQLEKRYGIKLKGNETMEEIQSMVDKLPKKASGGIAGQLHLNQGGAAWPGGRERFLEEEKIDDDWYMNKYEKFLDDYLTTQEGSADAFNQQDVNIISSFFNNYVEHGGDPTKFEERIQNLLKPPEKPSSGLSHILGV